MTIDEDLFDELLEHIAEGSTVTQFATLEGMPSVRVLMSWLHDDVGDEDRTARVRRARDDGREALHESLLDHAATSNDYAEVTIESEYGVDDDDEPTVVTKKKVVNRDNVARSKLYLDEGRRYLATNDPARFGPKSNVQVEGTVTIESLVLEAHKQLQAEKKAPVDDSGADLLG